MANHRPRPAYVPASDSFCWRTCPIGNCELASSISTCACGWAKKQRRKEEPARRGKRHGCVGEGAGRADPHHQIGFPSRNVNYCHKHVDPRGGIGGQTRGIPGAA
jgi:hypothetical protein